MPVEVIDSTKRTGSMGEGSLHEAAHRALERNRRSEGFCAGSMSTSGYKWLINKGLRDYKVSAGGGPPLFFQGYPPRYTGVEATHNRAGARTPFRPFQGDEHYKDPSSPSSGFGGRGGLLTGWRPRGLYSPAWRLTLPCSVVSGGLGGTVFRKETVK